MSNKIIFFGNERLATGVSTTVPVLQGLIAGGYEVAAVVVAQAAASDKSRQVRELEIAKVAAAHAVPLLTPTKLADSHDQLKGLEAAAAVLVAYGKLVPQSIIDLFPVGIINIHPSLLPKHRGPTPIESVILYGEEQTGVSLMKLVAAMDAGPIFVQSAIEVEGSESKQQLADQLINLGRDMLLQNLPAILSGKLSPQPQADQGVTYDKRIDKKEAHIETLGWDQPAVQLARKVRAYAGWPRVRTTIGSTTIIITAAHVSEVEGTAGTLWLHNQEMGIHTGQGTLIIDRLIPPGKKEMTGNAFIAGYRPI